MEDLIKVIASIVALISGLLALGKGALDLWKEYQANKATLSVLLTRRRFRIAAILAFVGIVVLIGAVWWSTSRTQAVLTAQIWDIELDEKHAIIASKQFTISAGNTIPDETLQEVGRWVTEQIAQRYNLSAGTIKIHLYVPADLSKGKLEKRVTPPVPVTFYFWLFGESGKLRSPLQEQALANLGKDFDIEMNMPGYEVQTVHVTWGKALDQDFTLVPFPVAIGVEEFSGEKNSIATWLTDYLVRDSRFSIKDPKTLKALQDKIAEGKVNSTGLVTVTAQQPIRSSLGLNLIISGVYEMH